MSHNLPVSAHTSGETFWRIGNSVAEPLNSTPGAIAEHFKFNSGFKKPGDYRI